MPLFKTKTLAFAIHAFVGFSIAQTGLAQAASPAEPNVTTGILLEQSHAVYHRLQSQSLKSAIESVAGRTGIVFKIHPSVEGDRIEKKLAAASWNEAIEQLLAGYNYVVENQGSQVTLVTVTGRNHNGHKSAVAVTTHADTDLIVIEPKSSALPAKYKHFKKGSVQTITISDELIGTPVGQTVTVDLPNGRYTVTHDEQIKHGENQTWIGHLDEGIGYRFSLSQGQAGTMGAVMTPDGEYLIETTQGQTIWVDLNRSGLKNAGFEGDTQESSYQNRTLSSRIAGETVSMDAAVHTSPSDLLARFKGKADTARARVSQLTQKVVDSTEKVTMYKQLLTEHPAAVTTANADLLAARMALKTAKEVLTSAPKSLELKNQVKVASSQVKAATQTRLTILKLLKVYKANIKKLTAELNKAKKLLVKAESDAVQSENFYQNELKQTVRGINKKWPGLNTPEIPFEGRHESFNPDTTIDLMVMYTTQGQTADYAKQRIQYIVDLSNQANQDSGVNMQYRLVHTESIDYPEATDNGDALYDIAYQEGGAHVRELRNQYGADVVILFRPFYSQATKSCGRAFMGGPTRENEIKLFREDGYAVVSDNVSKDDYHEYCYINTFAHEIGHLLGNTHEVENSNGGSGLFPYSFAWSVPGKFGTIMGYARPGIMLFSSPNLATECVGEPCGYPEGDPRESDQARTMNAVAPFMAKYRESMTVTPSIE